MDAIPNGPCKKFSQGSFDLVLKLPWNEAAGVAENTLAPVVQRLDSAIHRINHYPVDKYWGDQLRYPVDRDLSDGLRYPPDK